MSVYGLLLFVYGSLGLVVLGMALWRHIRRLRNRTETGTLLFRPKGIAWTRTRRSMVAVLGLGVGIMFLYGVYRLYSPGSKTNDLLFLGFVGVFASLGLQFYWDLKSLELRENGIIGMDNYYPWRQVDSFYWEGKQKNELRVTFLTPGGSPEGWMVMPIRMEQKEEVEAILKQKMEEARKANG